MNHWHANHWKAQHWYDAHWLGGVVPLVVTGLCAGVREVRTRLAFSCVSVGLAVQYLIETVGPSITVNSVSVKPATGVKQVEVQRCCGT